MSIKHSATVMLERLAELFDEDRGANTRVRSRRAA
jgi:hypothetical protein